MPILIRNSSKNGLAAASAFSKEEELELVLAGCPSLLLDGENVEIRFVARQVKLEAGEIDLLLVDSSGLPIVIEVKLARNSEARREVVAQAIDYISSLTELTVDELDDKVGGKLETALRDLSGSDDSKFDLLWRSVGTNLRDGRARLIVAMDDAPPDLQRIFRFLARNSDLDVQLVSVQQYISTGAGDVFVPQILVSMDSVDRPSRATGTREPYPELVDVFDAYNALAPPDLRAFGVATNYRMIRPAEFPGRKDLHYSFQRKRDCIEVQLRVPGATEVFPAIAAPLDGKPVAGGKTLAWDKEYDKGNGRLFVSFPLATEPDTVAQAMRDLITLTRDAVRDKLPNPATKAVAQ